MITEIAFIGIPATDMKRSRAFYEGVLGLKCTHEAPGVNWVEYDIGAGTNEIRRFLIGRELVGE